MKQGYILNRKVYKSVKKMDHSQMSDFLKSVYMNGRADGVEATEGLNLEEIKQVILGLKGIGEKRATMILDAIDARLNEKHVEKE